MGWVWQVLMALLVGLLAALAVAPPRGGGGNDRASWSSSSSASPPPAEMRRSCAALATDADVAALVPPLWDETAALFMDAVREAAGAGGGGEGRGRGLTLVHLSAQPDLFCH